MAISDTLSALAWLAHVNAGLDWHYPRFWVEIRLGNERAWDDDLIWYIRTTRLTGLLDHWYRRLGLAALSSVQRGRSASRYDPDVDVETDTPQLRPMCNRYQPGERHSILNLFGAIDRRATNGGSGTVHPKEPGRVIQQGDGGRVLEQMTWGFPVALRGKQGQLLKLKPVNNARFDKLGGCWKRWATNPGNRCLIPTARYAEAADPPGEKTETWLLVKEQPIFAWAGLWRPTAEWGDCYTGVMTSNTPALAHIHDRSPVIVDQADRDAWLTVPFDALAQFERPYPAEQFRVEATDTLWIQRRSRIELTDWFDALSGRAKIRTAQNRQM